MRASLLAAALALAASSASGQVMPPDRPAPIPPSPPVAPPSPPPPSAAASGEVSEREPNDLPDKATPIGLGGKVRGKVHTGDGYDYFSIETKVPGKVTIRLSGQPADCAFQIGAQGFDEKNPSRGLGWEEGKPGASVEFSFDVSGGQKGVVYALFRSRVSSMGWPGGGGVKASRDGPWHLEPAPDGSVVPPPPETLKGERVEGPIEYVLETIFKPSGEAAAPGKEPGSAPGSGGTKAPEPGKTGAGADAAAEADRLALLGPTRFPDELEAMARAEQSPTEANLRALADLRSTYAVALAREAGRTDDAEMQARALLCAQEAASAFPKEPDRWILLGRLYARMSGPFVQRLAEDAFRRALEIDPRHGDARLMLGQSLFHQARYDAAIGVLEPLAKEPASGPPPGLVMILAAAYASDGQSARGEAFLAERWKAAPACDAAGIATALLRARLGRREEAIAAVESVARRAGVPEADRRYAEALAASFRAGPKPKAGAPPAAPATGKPGGGWEWTPWK